MIMASFNSNTTGVTSVTGTADPSGAPEFSARPFLVAFMLLNLKLSVKCFVAHYVSYCRLSLCHLYCLFFFDLRLLTTPLVF
jgi:hypothetical protein